MKRPIRGTIIWFILLILFCIFRAEMNYFFFSVFLSGVLIFTLCGIILCIRWLVSIGRGQGSKIGSVMVILIVAAGYLGLFSSVGYYIGIYRKFFWNNSYYEEVVSSILKQKSSKSGSIKKPRDCIIDEGPPVRVAFIWGGVMDNWHGIVYDPTGLVMRANESKLDDWSNGNDPSLIKVKSLFYGVLIRAELLWKDWYYCVFT